VSLIGKASLMLAVRPDLKVRSFAEFLQLVKSRPRSINYGTGGAGHPTHVIMELIANRLGLQMTHVPYKGTSPAMQGMLAGEIDAMIVGMAEGLPHLRTGKVVALGGSGPSVKDVLPGVPELKDFHPDLDVSVWFGVFAPASTPADVVASTSREIYKVLGSPDVRRRLSDYGLAPVQVAPAELDQLAQTERGRYGPLIKALGLTVD
jgi:tripartite-type tricarboxylate transporter receptor subunit TctC